MRLWLVAFVDDVAKRHGQYVQSALPALSLLVSDASPKVGKKALAVVGKLVRVAMAQLVGLVSPSPSEEEAPKLWEAVKSLLAAAAAAVSAGHNDALRMHAAKLLEQVVLLFTPAEDEGALTARTEFNVSLLEETHPLVAPSALMDLAQGYLGKLLAALEPPKGGAGAEGGNDLAVGAPPTAARSQLLITAIGAASRVGTRRPQLLRRCAEGLSAASSGAARQSAQDDSRAAAGSVGHALQNALIALIKGSRGVQSPYSRGLLVQALIAAGEGDAAEAAVMSARRSDRKAEREAKEREAKRTREEEEAQAAAAKRQRRGSNDGIGRDAAARSGTTPEAARMQLLASVMALVVAGEPARPQLMQLVEQLPADVLAEFVLANVTAFADQRQAYVPPAGGAADPVAAVMAAVTRDMPQQEGARDPRKRRDPRLKAEAAAVGDESGAAASGAGADAAGGQAAAVTTKTGPRPLVAPPLAPEERTKHRRAALARMLDSQERVARCGAARMWFALLPRLAGRFDELEADKVGKGGGDGEAAGEGEAASGGALNQQALLEYLLGDYGGRDGHTLLLQTLYDAYARHQLAAAKSGSEGGDGSRARANGGAAYDALLEAAAKGLLERLPPTSRALPRVLMEAPALPASIFKLLKSLCAGGEADRQSGGERSTLGLSTLRDLVLHRPPVRQRCLMVCLEAAVGTDDAVRSKAIRLISNKLFPEEHLVGIIEAFALQAMADASKKGAAPDVGAEESEEAAEAAEKARQKIQLALALCVRRPAMLPEVAGAYASAPKCVKQIFHRSMPGLARTLGAASEPLLALVADPPAGAEPLALQALHIAADSTGGKAPPEALLATARGAFKRTRDARYVAPVLHALSREELDEALPRLCDGVGEAGVRAALTKLLRVPEGAEPLISAADVIVLYHTLDLAKHSLSLKKVVETLNVCASAPMREVFDSQSVAAALQRLVAMDPVPLLTMRTVMQALQSFPKLSAFAMDLLGRLIARQVWRMPKLWEGFLRCVQQASPQSIPVFLQLPPQVLAEALKKLPGLHAPCSRYAAMPNASQTIPRATLDVLRQAAPPPRAPR